MNEGVNESGIRLINWSLVLVAMTMTTCPRQSSPSSDEADPSPDDPLSLLPVDSSLSVSSSPTIGTVPSVSSLSLSRGDEANMTAHSSAFSLLPAFSPLVMDTLTFPR